MQTTPQYRRPLINCWHMINIIIIKCGLFTRVARGICFILREITKKHFRNIETFGNTLKLRS